MIRIRRPIRLAPRACLQGLVLGLVCAAILQGLHPTKAAAETVDAGPSKTRPQPLALSLAAPQPASPPAPPASAPPPGQAAPGSAGPALTAERALPPPPLPAGQPAAPQAADEAAALDRARQDIGLLQGQALATEDDDRLGELRSQSAADLAAADKVLAERSAALRVLDHELGRGGGAPRRPARNEPERRKRTVLLKQRAELGQAVADAQTVSSQASRIYDLIAERRRESFTSKVLQQTASPVSPSFWGALAEASGPDFERLAAVAQRAASAALDAPEPKGLLSFIIAFAFAFALMVPARSALEKLVTVRAVAQAHTGFRLSARAVWIVLVDTLLPALAANTLHLGAQWGGLLSERANALAGAVVIAITWGAAVVSLGRATVAGRDPGSRLMDIPEDAVGRVRFYLWLVAGITGFGFLFTRINYVIGASVAATVASNCLMSLAYVAVAALVLVSFGRSRSRREIPVDDRREAARSSNWTLLSLALSVAIIVTVAAVIAGYTTLAVLISGQIFWLSLLAAATYLVLRFIDDLSAVLFRSNGIAARTLTLLFSLRPSTLDQISVLTAAGLQICVVLGAVSLALTPFGQSGAALLAHVGELGHSIHIGSAVISPTAVFSALLTLLIGMAFVHFVRRWVETRYLPVTDWDAGVRNSVATGVGYVGVAVVALCALAAMGLGFKQVALVASALSVGIGFGLQQVVQNFVSGLILLIERPIKVGDWIDVNGVEGDVRSIRVRATEIQMFDRSLAIVPNSDLITKLVKNKTYEGAKGRVTLTLSIADPADAKRAAALIVKAAGALEMVLQDPPPAVYIESLAAGGAVTFFCVMFVAHPREVMKSRSLLYHTALEAFIQNKVAFSGSGGPQEIVVEPGARLEEALRAVRPAPGASEPRAEMESAGSRSAPPGRPTTG